MQTPIYHNGRALAILAGVAATGGALAILLAEPITTGNWRLEHGLLPIIVGLTIIMGLLINVALRRFKFVSAMGFAVVFCVGTALTIYTTVGYQKEKSANKAATAEAHNAQIQATAAQLVTARSLLKAAEAGLQIDQASVRAKCADGPGKLCRGAEAIAAASLTFVKGHKANVSELEAEMAKLGGEIVARPKAQALGEIAEVLFGFSRRQVEMAATVLEPFAFSLLFELAAIVAFEYGFAAKLRPMPAPVAPETAAMPVPRRTMTVPTLRIVHPTQKEAALKDLQGLLAAGQVIPSQDWLTARWNLQSKGTTSKWLSDWETSGLVSRASIGRFKTVDRAA